MLALTELLREAGIEEDDLAGADNNTYLRVMVGNVHRRVGQCVVVKYAHCGIEQDVFLRIAHPGCQCILLSSAVFSYDDPTSENVLVPSLVRDSIYRVGAVRSVACKVHTLSVT